MLPEKNVCRLCCFFSLFCYQLHKHLIPQTSPRLPGPPPPSRTLQGEKKTHRRAGLGTTWPGHIYNFISPFSVITRATFFSLPPLSLALNSVCEDQVGKVRLQPVPGNHLTEFWRAIVWEFKVRAQAALAERVQVLIHKRQGEVSWIGVAQLRPRGAGGEI